MKEVPALPFHERLLTWWESNGRKDLPWQHPRTPSRVWISEIMLQQPTVKAVAPYYARFLARWPDIEALGAAHLDEVLKA